MPELRAGYRTDTGRVRVVNQDNFIAVRSLFAVADGMGGHAGGEVASRIAVEAVGSASLATVGDLIEAVQLANAEIYHQSVTNNELHGMGTTFCGLALLRDGDHEEMVVVNVGDSRVYVLQDGKLLQITRDHSFVEDLVAAGEITHEEARHHPRRHIVTRVLGIEP
ncbi:MAG: protein phosphatase 2C domain-containing protein, partial [Acidimicrobiia bacterium]